MSSPVAHSLTGYLIYRLTVRQDETDRWPPLWAYIAMANFPDIDIVFGLLQNTPFQYHHESIANSIGMTLAFTLLAWGCARVFPNGLRWRRAWLFSALYGTHVLMDFFGAGRAVPILWPLDAHPYINPLGVMPGFVKNHASNAAFLASLMHVWNGVVVLIECAVLLPAIYLAERWRGRRLLEAPPTRPGRKE
ncbi:MAG: hypothetical protein ETSY1_21315 [Candidatus Entotheonella factor]|uniref:Metal-dependent hydrolase n=2 Tax=Candidatus Entotheonella TaxID=93171 RepID=W4LIK9_ENTF1|nr:MAG: hypothetical protein ETSY1_21315 [Candidatus Entotheonella factor]